MRRLLFVCVGAWLLAACSDGSTGPSEGAPVALRIRGAPAHIGRLQPISGLRVEIVDADGHVVTSASDSVTIDFGANSNDATLVGQTRVPAVGGVATFGPLAISKAGPDYTLVASSGTLAPDTSAAFDVGGVALFAHPSFAEWSLGSRSAQASNLYDSYRFLGLDVRAFGSLDFMIPLQDAWVLALPDLTGDVWAAMASAQRTAVFGFVQAGGTLIVHGDANGLAFVNQLFGYSITTNITSGPYVLTDAAAGTPFEGGPTSLLTMVATVPLSIASLPASASVVYQRAGAEAAVVVVIPRGSGQIVWIGWDWYNAPPTGDELGGPDWLEVLYRATRY